MTADPRPDPIFRQCALAEAARYGSDPWVWVRELLQNARDAGARRVSFEVIRDGATERVICRDDGSGMDLEHARRYLFALYASSKEDQPAEAGRFGIGFWSVLRFAPRSIQVRSRRAGEPTWRVRIDGALEHPTLEAAERGEGDFPHGTEVVLERPAGDGDLGRQVAAAARRYGRFLSRRDAAGEPLRLTVDGDRINESFSLPAPCATFRGKGFRGAVGLGSEPRVELFAHGLFVRSAASLRDLRQLGERSGRDSAEDALAELPSLAPQILLDSSELDLLLARSDAREDRHLRRMLGAAERALGRLITRQLQALRPQPWYRIWWGALRDRLELLPRKSLATALAAGFVLGLAGLWWLPLDHRPPAAAGPRPAEQQPSPAEEQIRPATAEAGPRAERGTAEDPRPAAGARPPAGPRVHPYSDLAARYRGPHAGRAGGTGSTVALLYEPQAAGPLLFAALVLEEPAAGSWTPPPLGPAPPPYRGSRCRHGCVDVQLLLNPEPGEVRLPVPTGHRLDDTSVRLEGRRPPVFENAGGEAVLRLDRGRRSTVRYRTGPAPAPRPAAAAPTAAAVLPEELLRTAEQLRPLPLPDRVAQGLLYVARRIPYDRSPAAQRSYDRARASGADFAAAALAAGAGDCDVQNGILVSLLRRAGVEARLAIGYVGTGGTVSPGLHAWVEYNDGRGSWLAADASAAGDGADEPHARLASLPGDAAAAAASPGTPLPESPKAHFAGGLVVAAVLLLALGSTTVLLRRRRGAPAVELGPTQDLAALLGGALRHPGAFAGLPAMFHGRFVPLLEHSGAMSLHRARRLARAHRLFRSALGSPLARRAAARGVPVVDAATPEGHALSLALGAIDLDRFSELLERSREPQLCRRLNRQLAEAGAPWRVRDVPGLGEAVTELALEDAGLGERLVLTDLTHAEVEPLIRGAEAGPESAAFTLLDFLAHRCDLSPRARARLLATAARGALAEADR